MSRQQSQRRPRQTTGNSPRPCRPHNPPPTVRTSSRQRKACPWPRDPHQSQEMGSPQWKRCLKQSDHTPLPLCSTRRNTKSNLAHLYPANTSKRWHQQLKWHQHPKGCYWKTIGNSEFQSLAHTQQTKRQSHHQRKPNRVVVGWKKPGQAILRWTQP